jgi:hypothetical protein
MLIQLSITSTNIFIPLEDSQRLFTFSVNHPPVSSSPLAETISGFWQSYYVVLQLPSDLVQIHLHHWICSEQIWTARICAPRSTVRIGFRAPCHSIFKRRGGVRNWAHISRAVRIKAPRSMTLKRFWTPFAILPLIKGGGVRNGGVSRKGPIPVVSPFVSFSSPPAICSPPDRAPRLVPFSPSLSSDICPSPNYRNSEV